MSETTDKERPLLRVGCGGRTFVLPYIAREMAEYDVVGADASDADIEIAEAMPAGEPAHAVLVCPNIVGTGMTGLPMELARRVASGSFFHIEGNEARLSVVHATDVARAVRLALGHKGAWTVTDGCDPTFDDLAEALAHRLGDKRILTLKPLWARFLMNGRLRRTVTADCRADGSEFASRFGFSPTPVTEYLTTHVYDDESL